MGTPTLPSLLRRSAGRREHSRSRTRSRNPATDPVSLHLDVAKLRGFIMWSTVHTRPTVVAQLCARTLMPGTVRQPLIEQMPEGTFETSSMLKMFEHGPSGLSMFKDSRCSTSADCRCRKQIQRRQQGQIERQMSVQGQR